jgi:hypothetical protein
MDRQVFKHVLDSEKAFMNGNYFYRQVPFCELPSPPNPDIGKSSDLLQMKMW